jgi:hypothetical protein
MINREPKSSNRSSATHNSIRSSPLDRHLSRRSGKLTGKALAKPQEEDADPRFDCVKTNKKWAEMVEGAAKARGLRPFGPAFSTIISAI